MIHSYKPVLAVILLLAMVAPAAAQGWLTRAAREFPMTDFSRTVIDLDEIMSGGPPRDGIPPIDQPAFRPIGPRIELGETEPVIGVIVEGEARAYPLQILIWHEIVNDTLAGVPIAVTFCPLCNTGIVFDRRVGERVLDFGTTGRLRRSDLVMYDRQTESWWQQFLGQAVIGELTGTVLKVIPARLESYAKFRARAPQGLVMVPNGRHFRSYGSNPYAGYDSSTRPFLYRGEMPAGIAPLARVVRVGARAWSLDLLRRSGRLEDGDLRLSWSAGQNSALDRPAIALGADVGNVVVEERVGDGWRDTAYSVDFAFAFKAFYPNAAIRLE
ncbi:MAG: DUF3179 domain-containing protein [Alphaproteobacteria bacterium]|jgi:hypothetical protein|nr:DUF3179 domain-containing protein [Alphaproteobacteria bacterium]MDP6517103.1 DUF3179 domain-containing protein [Alphaproteobacteria bacterium]